MMWGTHNSTMPTQGQCHRWRSRVSAFNLVSFPHLLSTLEGFSEYFGKMSALVRRCAEPMTQHARWKSRSQMKVTSLIIWFSVCSISPLPLQGFSLNLNQSTGNQRIGSNSWPLIVILTLRLHAKLMFQPCHLKVKVTVECGGEYNCPSCCK